MVKRVEETKSNYTNCGHNFLGERGRKQQLTTKTVAKTFEFSKLRFYTKE